MRIPQGPIGLRLCVLAMGFAWRAAVAARAVQSTISPRGSRRASYRRAAAGYRSGTVAGEASAYAGEGEGGAGCHRCEPRDAEAAARTCVAPPPPAPANVCEWGLSHFLAARTLGNARLVSAVQQLVKSPQRTDAEAEMLDKLLRPPPVIYDAKGRRLPGGPAVPSPELVQAVVVALAVNNTDAGRQTLAQLIEGDFAAVNQKVAAGAAMAALLDQGSRQGEQIVLRRLFAPRRDRTRR